MDKSNKKETTNFKEYIKVVAITAVITMVFTNFIARPVSVNGDSMVPTFRDGQILIINELTKDYSINDIVVCNAYNTKLIKRIIGVPGDTVQIKNGSVYINGSEHPDNFPKINQSGLLDRPTLLNEGEYIVLGDNRNNSIDSRFPEVGIIKKDKIIGKVFLRIFPLNKY